MASQNLDMLMHSHGFGVGDIVSLRMGMGLGTEEGDNDLVITQVSLEL